MFWKIPVFEQDPFTVNKKLSPEFFQKVKLMKFGDNRNKVIATSVVFNSHCPSKKPVLFIGTSEGYCEAYVLSVNEFDDDDSKAKVDDVLVFEDDGTVFRLEDSIRFRIRLFESNVDLLTLDASGAQIVAGSSDFDELYILKFMEPCTYAVVSRIKLGIKNDVVSFLWDFHASYYSVLCRSGNVKFFPKCDVDDDSVVVLDADNTIELDLTSVTSGITISRGALILHGIDNLGLRLANLAADARSIGTMKSLGSTSLDNIKMYEQN